MKALVGAFNQEKSLVGAFSVIMKTDCETDGTLLESLLQTCSWCPDCRYANVITVKIAAYLEFY